MITGTTLN